MGTSTLCAARDFADIGPLAFVVIGILKRNKPLLVGHWCQPWFYLRLKAYGYIGLSEGEYGAL